MSTDQLTLIKRLIYFLGHELTLQAFTEEHPKPPLPLHGSVKEISTETFRAFVNDDDAVIYAVGGTVSAKMI